MVAPSCSGARSELAKSSALVRKASKLGGSRPLLKIVDDHRYAATAGELHHVRGHDPGGAERARSVAR